MNIKIEKYIFRIIVLSGFVLIYLLVHASSALGDYNNIEEAFHDLVGGTSDSPYMAAKYLAARREESIPRLMQIAETRDTGCLYAGRHHACYALALTKDTRVTPFLIDLLRNNYQAKVVEIDTREYGFGSPYGCIGPPKPRSFFGQSLALDLEMIGDTSAIPVLKEALEKGDAEVRRGAYSALFELGGLSLDEIFDIAKRDSDTEANLASIILEIGGKHIYPETQTTFALTVFDRVIAELPSHEYEVASAHFSKIQCYEILKQYSDALRECEVVMKFSKFNNLTTQVAEYQERLRELQTKKGGK